MSPICNNCFSEMLIFAALKKLIRKSARPPESAPGGQFFQCIQQRRENEGKCHCDKNTAEDAKEHRGQRGGKGVADDDTVQVHDEGVQSRHQKGGGGGDENQLRAGEGKALAFCIQPHDQPANARGENPENGGGGETVGQQLAEKAARETHCQPVQRPQKKGGHQNGQGIQRDFHGIADAE